MNSVAALLQCGLTVTVQVRHSLTMEQLAIWSIQGAEVRRSQEQLLTDSFPAFALKCLKVLKNDMTASDAKATKLLGDAGVTYRGSKVNRSMANAVLMFRPGTIDSHALELLRKIERDHGREAFCGGYVKIARLVQLCTEAAKATLEHSSTELITYVLGAIEFTLRMEIWKVSDMTVTALDKTRDGTPGYVLLILARRQVLGHFELLMDDLRANDMAKSVVEDLDALLQHTRNYGTYEHAFPASEGGDSVETYKNKHTKTKTGQIATDFVYDLLGGAHDEVLRAAIKANAATIKDMNWATIDLAL